MRFTRPGTAVLVVAFVAPLLTLLSASPTAAAAVRACDLTEAPDGMTLFTWTGADSGGSDLWEDPDNWDVEGNPVHDDDGVPNYIGTDPDKDDSLTGLICVDPLRDADPGDTASVRLTDNVNVHAVALDVAAGTSMTIGEGARVFVYGNALAYQSRIAEGADVELNAGTLGGYGTIQLAGHLRWHGMTAAETQLVPGPSAASLDTDHCPPLTTIAACRDDNGTGPRGRLVVDPTGVVDVDGIGVNLFDRYQLDVLGLVRLSGDSFIAADRGAAIHVADGGTFEFANDGSVFEGQFNGRPPSALATFQNDGLVVKSSGDGISAINAAYAESSTGRIVVSSGSLNVPDGHNAAYTDGAVTAYVRPGGSLGTASCPQPDNLSGPCVPGTDADAADAVLTVPESATDGGEVAIYEQAVADDDGSVQPPVNVGVADLEGEEVTLTFTYRDLPGTLAKDRLQIYRGSTKGTYRRAPLCSDVGDETGVYGCVRGHADDGGDVVITVDATDPNGWWTARGTAQVYGRPTAPVNNGLGIGEIDLASYCSAPGDGGGSFVTRWRDEKRNDHWAGWRPDEPGAVTGPVVAAPGGDLDQLGAVDLRVMSPSGDAAGVVVLTWRESANTRWRGVASVTAKDREGSWRLKGHELTYTWTKYVDGIATGEPQTSTLPAFRGAHERTADVADDDTVAVGFGCDGKLVLMDDLVVTRVNGVRDDAWDLEAKHPHVRLGGGDIGRQCQLSARDWPNKVNDRTISLSDRGRWEVRFARDGRSGFGTTLKDGFASAGDVSVDLELTRKGKLLVLFTGSAKLRAASSLAIDAKVSPVIDIGRAPNAVYRNQRIKVSGRFAPRDHVPYKVLVAEPGTERLEPVGRLRKSADDGRFSFIIDADELGDYAIAVQAEPTGKLARAVSRRAVHVTVNPRPPDPPDPVLEDFDDDGEGTDDGYPTDQPDDNDGIEFRFGPLVGRVGSCIWRVDK